MAWMNSTLQRYLAKGVECPSVECERRSSCLSIVDPKWATLLGWGNPEAPVAFVGLNPHYSAEGRSIHEVPTWSTPFQHVRSLSLEGFSNVRHFRYHRRILKNLRESDSQLAEELFDDLDLFAFYTEVALCPTEPRTELPPEVFSRCFEQNAGAFLDEQRFPFVVALGYEASFQVVRRLISAAQAQTLLGNFHGRLFQGPGPRFVITSYHPNYSPKGRPWDRDVVARLLLEASRRSGIALY